MEAIRHIITPKSRQLHITLPDSLVDETIEVIILPINSSRQESAYSSLRGKISREEAEKMLKHVKQSREEWE